MIKPSLAFCVWREYGIVIGRLEEMARQITADSSWISFLLLVILYTSSLWYADLVNELIKSYVRSPLRCTAVMDLR